MAHCYVYTDHVFYDPSTFDRWLATNLFKTDGLFAFHDQHKIHILNVSH